ncbi:RCC1-like G exchanging factor-like protein isoform X2 [Limulus polyphemus]|uniref:RCC1-like G exchanging factor-like protein isoform X2 n=1 Tax=Limulus polyphemus TaxID=6850 RepID=A0ABM1TE54_LIMPO|nr:RCC1-like G exchanging factor-like protein isoform X2 [Limulus polyphemus]XP_022254160.1 RCC1-like G exchanging factor-like protein isoform X2 [Limulus polyphemus]
MHGLNLCGKMVLFKPSASIQNKTFSFMWRTLASFMTTRAADASSELPVFQYATEKTSKTTRVYTWGHASYGALGNANFIKPKDGKKVLKNLYRPYRLEFAETHKVFDVACGYGFTVFAAFSSNSNHRAFGTGLNTDSQIGFHMVRKDHPLQQLAQPVPIHLPLESSSTKAVKVACGRAHSVILTDKEGIFTLGNNAFGQCGRVIVENEVYEGSTRVNKVSGIDGEVIDVVCGQDHTLFLTKEGRVYSCGWGADGQTGLGHYNSQGKPGVVKGDIEKERIIKLCTAVDCVLAVSDNGDLFGWGNSEYGQFSNVTDALQVNVPRHVPLSNIGKILDAAVGGTICAVLNDKGQVFVWGYGILGQGPQVAQLNSPTLLPEELFGRNEFNPEVKVTHIKCGLNQFAAITNQGDLYMWGKNRHACLGLGHKNDQYFPFRVSVPAQVLKISLGVDHTAVLCKAFS